MTTTDKDLELARDLCAKATNYYISADTYRSGLWDDQTCVKVALAAIKAGRAAEKAECDLPDDLRDMAKRVEDDYQGADFPGFATVILPALAKAYDGGIKAGLAAGRAAGVAHERERCAWQPIETAPSDLSLILTYDPRMKKEFCIEIRPADGGFWRWERVGPSHWMPLPAPPVAAAIRKGGEHE